METDKKTLEKWESDYTSAELAYINPKIQEEIEATVDFSILPLIDYIPSERSQGWCGNCWAWPATALLEIALNVQKGIFDRLSVQYINSCGEVYNPSGMYQIGCCEGGNLATFANFYQKTDMAIPWSNTNANWQDNRAQCRTDCDTISTIPHYPITKILARTIKTTRIDESEAISNIKNILHQERGVYFTILFPDSEVLGDFQDFWRNNDEQYVYNLDYSCGVPYVEEEAAGHAVLCVGYHDDPNTDTNDYWIMLNSWGSSNKRPNGLFRIDMHMNYSCKYSSFYAPEITGPSNGKIGTTYTYEIYTVDPQDEDVYIFIDWGDGTEINWDGPYSSGDTVDFDHIWDTEGEYTISVQAKDINGKESDYTTFPVTMPKGKFGNNNLLAFDFLNFYLRSSSLFKLILELLQ